MAAYKRPIHRSLILSSAVFIAFMSFLLSIQAYLSYSKSLYNRYDDKLENILDYVTNQADLDDLYQNVITGERSEKYFQTRLPKTKFHTLKRPLNGGPPTRPASLS